MTNLQRIRKERGLSQRKLAELSGVNLRMIQKYESEEKDINHARAITVSWLAGALKCEINVLLEAEGVDKDTRQKIRLALQKEN